MIAMQLKNTTEFADIHTTMTTSKMCAISIWPFNSKNWIHMTVFENNDGTYDLYHTLHRFDGDDQKVKWRNVGWTFTAHILANYVGLYS